MFIWYSLLAPLDLVKLLEHLYSDGRVMTNVPVDLMMTLSASSSTSV
jgi:hypothetical protein